MTLVFSLALTALLFVAFHRLKKLRASPAPAAKKSVPVSSLSLKAQYAVDAVIYRASGSRHLKSLELWLEKSSTEAGFTVGAYEAIFRGGSDETVAPAILTDDFTHLLSVLEEEQDGWERVLLTTTVGAKSSSSSLVFA